MRRFLPIKGPGGRNLTTREKIALFVLGLTLVLCVLTLLAGERAFLSGDAQNPVFGFVGWLSRALGGGIVAMYGLVIVWSGLIYFKGERVADVTPMAGRFAAAVGVTIGISGALGIANLHSAGSLGHLVGGALGNTVGGPIGIPLLLLLMLLGVNLAGQGAWSALREPAMVVASPLGTHGGPTTLGFGLRDSDSGRIGHEPPLPDDGDPSPDERSLAVTQAMEEIERSHGVTIVEVEPTETDEAEKRSSIGEEVEAAPPPPPETEEAAVQRALADVAQRIESADEHDEDWYEEQQVEETEEDEDVDEEVVEEERVEEEVEDEEEEESGDPYAQGGLLKRLQSDPDQDAGGDARGYASFDWRGLPLD